MGTSSAIVPTQLYAMHADDKHVNALVMRGTVIYESSSTSILFDTGATSSFIASRFMHLLGLVPVSSNMTKTVDTPFGTSVVPS